jgi:hypothetical protein
MLPSHSDCAYSIELAHKIIEGDPCFGNISVAIAHRFSLLDTAGAFPIHDSPARFIGGWLD